MKITFGMACYDDYPGVYMTIMALLCNHDRSLFELAVVDNNPTTKHGENTKHLCNKVGATYIPYTAIRGTAAPRNMVFESARTEYVCCMDSHVTLKGSDFATGYPGGVMALYDYFRDNPKTKNMVTGPQVHDSFSVYNTHFNDEWGARMHGRWGQAWECGCRRPGALRFTVIGQNDQAAYFGLAAPQRPVVACTCGRELPAMPFNGSHQKLRAAGYKALGWEVLDPAFEIPAQGLGLFACRKDAWPGFNPNFRGFGGEEMYIHEKVRRNGGRVMCLPGLPWWHRYGKPEGIAKYPNNLFERARNYVLGRLELGLPYEDVRENMCNTGGLTENLWDYLVKDPINHTSQKDCKDCNSPANTMPTANTSTLPMPVGDTIEEVYEALEKMPRDLDQHMKHLRKMASMCQHVTEFSKRRESTVALLAAPDATVLSYNMEPDPLQAMLSKVAGNRLVLEHRPSTEVQSIPETDMLFIDSQHTERRALEELRKFGKNVKRFIVFHDTHTYGMRGEDGSVGGLLTALTTFIHENPEWFFCFHTSAQFGLTAIARNIEDGVLPMAFVATGHGPGTELKLLLMDMGITEPPKCDCNTKAKVMDNWGVAGCELRFPTIVQWLKEGQGRWGWTAKFGAGIKAITSGIAFHVNPLDPIPGLVRLAIERSKEKQRAEDLLHNANV